MDTNDGMGRLVIEPGTPVIIFGLSKKHFEHCDESRIESLPAVFAGRLSERHDGAYNRGLILAPGPMAASVPAKGVAEAVGFDLGEGLPKMLLLVREDEDVNGCAAYVAFTDVFGVVDGIERRAPNDWRGFRACLDDICRAVATFGSDGDEAVAATSIGDDILSFDLDDLLG